MRSNNELVTFAPGSVMAFVHDLFDRAPSRRLESGETLLGSQDEHGSCYLLEQGVLKLNLEAPDGRERILALVPRNSILGHLGFYREGSELTSLVALMACQLRYVSRSTLDDYARYHPDIYRLLGETLIKHMQDIERNIAATSFLNARGRVANALLLLAEHLGEPMGQEVIIPAMVTQRELAAMAGVARENVNRVLKSWEQQNVLQKAPHSYRIRDMATLRSEASVGE